jgi:hypothetical protein
MRGTYMHVELSHSHSDERNHISTVVQADVIISTLMATIICKLGIEGGGKGGASKERRYIFLKVPFMLRELNVSR